MSIVREINEEAYKALPSADQPFYQAGEGGKYLFSATDPSETKQVKTRATDDIEKVAKERDALKSKLDAYEAKQREAEHASKVASQNVDEVNAAWETKHKQEVQVLKDQNDKLQKQILRQYRDVLITEHAQELALPEYFDLAKLLLKDRIDATFDAKGNPQAIVYDEDKKLSRQSIKELVKSIKADKRYAKIMKGADVGSGAQGISETFQPVPTAPSPVSQQTVGKSFFKADAKEAYNYLTQRIKNRRT